MRTGRIETRFAHALGTLVIVAVFSGAAPAEAFWSRGQVSMCADATTDRERIRHRCHELNGYADPGWPALGLGAYGPGLHRGVAPGQTPTNRAPTRRLG